MTVFSRRKRPSAADLDRTPADDRTPGGAGADDADEAPVAVLDDETFMDGTVGAVTIVDFWAGWCTPCHRFAPTFRQAARLHADEGIRFAAIDVDAARRTAALVGVRSVPTVVVFGPDGSELTRATGLLPPPHMESLVAWAREHAPASPA